MNIVSLTSMILPKIILNRICNASAFFLSKLCPFWAPLSLDFINIWALKARKQMKMSHPLRISKNIVFQALKFGFIIENVFFNTHPLEGKIGKRSFPDIFSVFPLLNELRKASQLTQVGWCYFGALCVK